MHLPTVLTSFIHTGLGILIMMLSMALLIIIHEGGHWIVARLLGFQTPVFCIGFGPRKWSIVLGKFWQTEFRLSPILAGGYVALPEMQDETTAKQLLEKQGKDGDTVRFFPVWKRIAVALAGVTFNLIAAVMMLIAVFIFLGEPRTAVDSTAVSGFSSSVTIAHDAGFQPGDKFVSVGNERVVSSDDLIAALANYKGVPVAVVVERGNDAVSILVTPNQDGRIGATLAVNAHQTFVPDKPGQAVITSGRITKIMFTQTIQGFGMMLHVVPRPKEIPASALEVRGIVGIVQMGAAAYGQGLFIFVWYLVLISINLVIMNILPLPLLDGGHVVFFLWEKVSGKPVNAKLKGQLYRVFFALLIGVFALGFFHDMKHIILGN